MPQCSVSPWPADADERDEVRMMICGWMKKNPPVSSRAVLYSRGHPTRRQRCSWNGPVGVSSEDALQKTFPKNTIMSHM